MKLKVGQSLFSIREDKKLTQLEMSEILGVSPSVYARLERNETQADIQQLIRFAEILEVPIQQFLPDTSMFNNKIESGGIGSIFGNYIVNVTKEDFNKELETENKYLKKELSLKDELIQSLKRQIELGKF